METSIQLQASYPFVVVQHRRADPMLLEQATLFFHGKALAYALG